MNALTEQKITVLQAVFKLAIAASETMGLGVTDNNATSIQAECVTALREYDTLKTIAEEYEKFEAAETHEALQESRLKIKVALALLKDIREKASK